jgi:hypothetical protein
MADYHFPIALLQAKDGDLMLLTLAWASDSRGKGLLHAESEQAGGGLDIIAEAQGHDWYEALSAKVKNSIEEHKFSDYRAWAADRALNLNSGRRCQSDPEQHVRKLTAAKLVIRDAEAPAKTHSPRVWVPPIAWERAFFDDTERRNIAIRDFRVLCSLYSWIGESPARIVRRPAIMTRAFGFWSKEHTQEMIQSRIRQSLERGFTPRMIRDSLERLERCGEIIRISPSDTVTWYARGSSDPTVVVDHIQKHVEGHRANRSKSGAAQQLWELTEKRKQEGTK